MNTARGKSVEGLRVIWAVAAKDVVDALKNKTTISVIIGMFLMMLSAQAFPFIMKLAAIPRMIVYDAGSSRLVAELEDGGQYRLVKADSMLELEEILADAEEEYGKFYYQRKDVEYPEEKKKTMIQGLLKNPPKGILGKRVVDTKTYDGVKFLCEDASWLLLRLSGTEPIVRVYAEAESDKKALEIIDFGKSLIT